MANIAVTNFCNLHCPYCFADGMIQEAKHNITIDELRQRLEWLSRTPNNHVGLIGGEPTLHPQFKEILTEVNKYCKEVNTGATLFTNGIYLDKYVADISERIGILINVNTPSAMLPEQHKMLMNTLDHLDTLDWIGRRANLGVNICMEIDDYSFIWDIVDKYKVQGLRFSVVAPTYNKYKTEKERYYNDMKPKFLNFCKEAEKRHVVLNQDCNHIPDCYFTDTEFELVRTVQDHIHDGVCNPVIDITVDGRATSCFGTYDPVEIDKFENINQLDRYLMLTKNYPLMCKNITGKCTMCEKAKLLKCQGGCLGFATATEQMNEAAEASCHNTTSCAFKSA